MCKKGGYCLILACFVLFNACTGKRPSNIGVTGDKLAPCPTTPNCVSSFATDERHKIAPLKYSLPSAQFIADLKLVLSSMEDADIIMETDHYLYAEFTSKTMRFVDDVEFYLDEENRLLNFRSASRLGYGDFGVNRKRIESIRSAIQKLEKH